MNKQLRLAILAATMTAALSAQAGTGFLFNLQVAKGRTSGGISDLRTANGKYFRITGSGIGTPKIDWTCSALSLGSPLNLSHIEVRISGSRTVALPIMMSLYDHIAQRWVEMGNVNLPTSGLGEVLIRDRRAPERFVSSNGVANVRFVTLFSMTMIIDRIIIRTVHE